MSFPSEEHWTLVLKSQLQLWKRKGTQRTFTLNPAEKNEDDLSIFFPLYITPNSVTDCAELKEILSKIEVTVVPPRLTVRNHINSDFIVFVSKSVEEKRIQNEKKMQNRKKNFMDSLQIILAVIITSFILYTLLNRTAFQ